MVILMICYIAAWNFTSNIALAMRLLYTICVANLPCLFLMLRLRKVQAVGSLESSKFLTDFTTNYKISGNFIHALDRTIEKSENISTLRAPLLRLSLSMKEYRTDDELKDVLSRFSRSIGTNWAKIFVNITYSAVHLSQDHADKYHPSVLCIPLIDKVLQNVLQETEKHSLAAGPCGIHPAKHTVHRVIRQ